MKALMRFFRGEKGIESAEYAVLGALIIVAIIVAVTALGTNISATFDTITAAIP